MEKHFLHEYWLKLLKKNNMHSDLSSLRKRMINMQNKLFHLILYVNQWYFIVNKVFICVRMSNFISKQLSNFVDSITSLSIQGRKKDWQPLTHLLFCYLKTLFEIITHLFLVNWISRNGRRNKRELYLDYTVKSNERLFTAYYIDLWTT